MRKKWTAALTVLGMVAGLAGINLLGAPSAQAYTPQSSCIVKSDLTICALSTDYGLFDPGAQKGSAVNNLLTAQPFGLANVAAGQYIYRNFYDPADSGQGTGVVATAPEVTFMGLPVPQAVNLFAAVVQSRANHPNCTGPQDPNPLVVEDDVCGQFAVEAIDVRLSSPYQGGLEVGVAHVFAAPPGGGASIDDFQIALNQLNSDGSFKDGLVILRFNNNDGCNLFLTQVGYTGLCNDRPTIGEILANPGLAPLTGPLAPVFAPLIPVLDPIFGDGNGPLIPGTPSALPYQPIPFLPVIPFLILP